MSYVDLVQRAQQALLLSVGLALPLVVVAAAVGLVMAALQTATQVHDAVLVHLPRLVAVSLALLALGPWMGREIAGFAALLFAGR